MFFLCDLNQIKKKDYLIKYIDAIKEEVIIFEDIDKKIRVFSSICPHFGGEITYLKKKNKFICKWHGWEFSTNDGKCLTYQIKSKLGEYNFNVEPKNLSQYRYTIKDNKIYLNK